MGVSLPFSLIERRMTIDVATDLVAVAGGAIALSTIFAVCLSIFMKIGR
jgi:Mn2+/Fe2+ NRAMP family transporter